MYQKISRNDPCLCGSGKKFKYCCGNKNDEYLKYREMEGKLQNVLNLYAESRYGKDCQEEAWKAFLQYNKKANIKREEMTSLFNYWYLYNWHPHQSRTIAESFISEHNFEIRNDIKEFVLNVGRSYFSFYEVRYVKPGHEVTVLDLLTHKEIAVTEFSASKMMESGNIIFARIVPAGKVNLFMGFGPFPLADNLKLSIISLRQSFEQEFGKMHDRLRETLFDTLITKYFDYLFNAIQPPKFKNTSGKLIEFHDLTYTHTSPAKLLNRLITLNPRPEEQIKNAERDAQGRIIKVVIPWISIRSRKDNDTVLGYLEITADRLVVKVNSSARASRIRGIIERRAGDLVRFSDEQISKLDELMNNETEKEPHDAHAENTIRVDYHADVDIAELLEKHWRKWVDIPIPALNGLTPAQAVKTPNGRELVAELLDWAEKQDKKNTMGSQIEFIKRTRKQLKLT